ncbi:MAG: hypothetical protein ABIJ09_17535 [Pseudomonadota bacterium]
MSPRRTVGFLVALAVIAGSPDTRAARELTSEVPSALQIDGSHLRLWLEPEPRNVPDGTPYDRVFNVRAVVAVSGDQPVWLVGRSTFWAERKGERVMLRQVVDLGPRLLMPGKQPFAVSVSLYSPPPGTWQISFQVEHDPLQLAEFQKRNGLLPPMQALVREQPTRERVMVGRVASSTLPITWIGEVWPCEQVTRGYLGYGPCADQGACWP